MKVGTKFALAFLVCGILSALVYSGVAASREASEVELAVGEDLTALGQTLRVAILAVWERDGEARAHDLVRYTDRDEHVEARWTWLDDEADAASSPHADRAVVVRVRQGQTQSWVGRRKSGERVVSVYLPLLREGQRPAALELSRPLVQRSHVFWKEVREQLLASTIVAAFVTFLAVVLTSWIVSRPLAEVAEQARRIGSGDLSHRLSVQGHDEVSSLVQDLNAMCDQLRDARTRADEESTKRIAALEQLRHADRLRTVGTLASGIAHELGTPLAVIAMRAKMVASGEVPKDEAPQSCAIIAAQADRVTRIVRHLLDFARRRTPRRARVDLGELTERAATLLSSLARKSNVQIVIAREHGEVQANVDASQLEQAITNLVINAVHAMPEGGTVTVATRNSRAAPAGAPTATRECAIVEIRDDGDGIAPEHLERIFEPFFTTKGVGEGTGLGLSVTHGIIEDHEGWMTATSVPGEGSIFTLFLPH
ncbi:MAG: sensory box histidine kinase/response regulator [Labilithrix sp.]|nr:sensory box histidine kinase/response regulator [Labilithrix sp.]